MSEAIQSEPGPDDASPGSSPTPTRRPIGKPFKPGCSGNPGGRKKGVPSLAAALARELTHTTAAEVARKLIDLAKSGDVAAQKLLWDRSAGRLGEDRLLAQFNMVQPAAEPARVIFYIPKSKRDDPE